MSDTEQVDEKPFYAERAPQGKAGCKKCKAKCNKGELRIGKVVANPFGEGKMKQWHHLECMFEVLLKQRLTTKRIENPDDDIGNWDKLSAEDQDTIMKCLEEFENDMKQKHGDKYVPPDRTTKKPKVENAVEKKPDSKVVKKDAGSKDNLFREFRRLCTDIANVSSYLEKTARVKELFTKGRNGDGFKGDVAQWCRLLLPGAHKRVYNLRSKQLIKLFSRIFNADADAMMEHLEQGDVSETIQHFFENGKLKPAEKSLLTLDEVEEFLDNLSKETKEDRQIFLLKPITKRCTGNDLKTLIRLIKHDLRINAGPKHILEGVHDDAYAMFQSTHDLDGVMARVLACESPKGKKGKGTSPTKTILAKISLMTPVLPMLAQACKSIEQAMKKCPYGMYSEIKYDGERVQLHKKGNEFKYFSRSLKPVLDHKVRHFKEFIPLAFPHGKDLILDSEILMIDQRTGKPLPFGTLGKHKAEENETANVCLFVFDCIYYNGEDLTQRPIKERKRVLKENMTEIKNHVMFSELKFINQSDDLAAMIAHTLKEGLEGLVLKDINSVYEPGKRHWLKVKKDYLFDGAMADSVDLVVLGAWFGTGKKGGMMSVFLMGCYDPDKKIWCTVTKVHTGHDDETLERLQGELEMKKISCDPLRLPSWLIADKAMVPDFVAKNPNNQPVWEITGAEFTQQGVHTADRISVRFPRVTRIRTDKDAKTATTLPELRKLVQKSKEHNDDNLFGKLSDYWDSGDFDISKITVPKFDSPQKEKEPEASTSKKYKQESSSDDDSEKKVKKSPLKRKLKNENKKVKKFKSEPDYPFPDIFQNVWLKLPKNFQENYADLLRYYIAYGGRVSNKSNANCVLHLENEISMLSKKYAPNMKHVTVQWLQQSIFSRKLQNMNHYAVTLLS